jgi:hypothetical protein
VGTERLWSWLGNAEHCDWGSATFLLIGANPGIDEAFHGQYVRDPEDLFTELLADEFVADIDRPEDADFTGYSTSKLKLWIAPSTLTAVYLELDDRFEQWPRAEVTHPILCE